MKVTLYTRVGCGLCERADALLKRLKRQAGFEMAYVDLDSDAEAEKRYWARIPVIAVDGVEVAAAPIDEAQLTAFLLR
ncbi:MAG TPA: glutaredoxin family protein [Dehalococcoidia bacterium]